MTLGLLLLRVTQIGLSISDLDNLEWGTVYDMMTESSNDDYPYKRVATQEDFDAF